MRLSPAEYPEHYDWSPTNEYNKKYALVGKISGFVHMVFDADSLQQADDIKEYYCKKRGDSDYELMVVDKVTLKS